MNLKDKQQLIAEAGKVAVLIGGNSAEKEISLLGGKLVLEALIQVGIEAVGIDAGEDLASALIAARPRRVFNIEMPP